MKAKAIALSMVTAITVAGAIGAISAANATPAGPSAAGYVTHVCIGYPQDLCPVARVASVAVQPVLASS